jgi:hypothetical protein
MNEAGLARHGAADFAMPRDPDLPSSDHSVSREVLDHAATADRRSRFGSSTSTKVARRFTT